MENQTSSNVQLQQNEKCALQAIYDEEFEEIQFPWKVLHPPQFNIRIREGDSTLQLMFKFPINYPIGEEVPQFTLTPSKGLEACVVSKVKEQMEKAALRLKGSEMVYELVEEARTVLVEQNLKPKKVLMTASSIPSAHDEMMLAKAHQKQQTTTIVSRIPNLKPPLSPNAQLELEERIKTALELKSQAKRAVNNSKKPVKLPTSITLDRPFWVHDALKGVKSPISCLSIVKAKQTLPGLASIFPTAEACLAKASSFWGQEFLVQQFPLVDESAGELNQKALSKVTDRDLAELEGILTKVESIRHPNISSLFTHSSKGLNSKFLLVSEWCNASASASGQTLDRLLASTGGMHPRMALRYLKQILIALQHLHANNLAHKYLGTNTILLQNNLDESMPIERLKLLYAGYIPDLLFFLHLQSFRQFKSMKDDIFDAGLVYLKCLFGEQQVNAKHLTESPAGAQKFIDQVPSAAVKLWIRQFFLVPIARRPTVEQLLEELERGNLLGEPEEQIGRALDCQYSISIDNPIPPTKKPSVFSSSRYAHDFDELEFLGKGAFGQVVKVRNKLDNQIYAVKIVLLDPSSGEENKKILREVTALSRFHHQHITRYFQAWLEDCPLAQWESLQARLEDDEEYSEETSLSSSAPRKPLLEGMLFYKDEDEETSLSASSSSSSSSSTDCQILYIQMEYCPNRTLKDLIEEGSLSIDESWRILQQVLEALAHIHSQGMIHRDLKPGNILIDMHGDVKVGDFGLVTDTLELPVDSLGQEENESEEILSSSTKNVMSRARKATLFSTRSSSRVAATQGVGTPFYTSPEVLAHSCSYDCKVDMYSLGIILFEMVYPMHGTGMERAAVLRALREEKIIFPSDFPQERLKVQHEIICNLLSHSPALRMSATALLESPLLPIAPSQAEDSLSGLREGALKSLISPTSTQHHKLIKALFSQGNLQEHFDVVREATFDFDALPVHSSTIEGREKMWKIFGALKSVARLMLFEPFVPIPDLIPCNFEAVQEPVEHIVRLMDSNGSFVFLPFDSAHPFARWWWQHSFQSNERHQNNSLITQLKRFTAGTVYRPNAAGGQPKHYFVAAFQKASFASEEDDEHAISDDILLLKALYLTFKELGLIRTVKASALSVAHGIGNLQLHLNHSLILDALFHALGREGNDAKSVVADVLESFAFLPLTSGNNTIASKLKNALATKHSLNGKQIDLLVACLCLRGEASGGCVKLLGKLSTLLPLLSTSGSAIGLQFKNLVESIELFLHQNSSIAASVGDEPLQIIINPLLHVPHHDGVLYAWIKTRVPSATINAQPGSNNRKRLHLLAQGGGIGGLLSRYKVYSTHSASNSSGRNCEVFLDRLTECISLAGNNDHTCVQKPSVIVGCSSKIKAPLNEKLKVANLLLNAGYPCEWTTLPSVDLDNSIGKFQVTIMIVPSKPKSNTTGWILRVKIGEKRVEFNCELDALLAKLSEAFEKRTDSLLHHHGHHQQSNPVNLHYLLMMQKKPSAAHLYQSLIERVQRGFGGGNGVAVDLVVHDLPRECIKGQQQVENEEVAKKLKALKTALERRERVVYYSVKEDCFDLP